MIAASDANVLDFMYGRYKQLYIVKFFKPEFSDFISPGKTSTSSALILGIGHWI